MIELSFEFHARLLVFAGWSGYFAQDAPALVAIECLPWVVEAFVFIMKSVVLHTDFRFPTIRVTRGPVDEGKVNIVAGVWGRLPDERVLAAG